MCDARLLNNSVNLKEYVYHVSGVVLLQQRGEDAGVAHRTGHGSGSAGSAGRGPEQDPRHSSDTGQGS